jgi:hypothetical protein
MTDNVDPGEDLVDDLFWLRRAGEMVRGASTLRSEAANRLMNALAWLWTVYTGAAVIAGSGHGTTSRVDALVLALPSLTIVAAYAAAMYAYLPMTLDFDPRSPSAVREAYGRAVERGWRRVRVALAFAGLAALTLGAAIAVVTVR